MVSSKLSELCQTLCSISFFCLQCCGVCLQWVWLRMVSACVSVTLEHSDCLDNLHFESEQIASCNEFTQRQTDQCQSVTATTVMTPICLLRSKVDHGCMDQKVSLKREIRAGANQRCRKLVNDCKALLALETYPDTNHLCEVLSLPTHTLHTHANTLQLSCDPDPSPLPLTPRNFTCSLSSPR